jgi:ACS family hexuronate transporter-like MFS transporter
LIAFGVCALLSSTLLALPWLSHGPFLLAILLVAGAGALGVFPIYHALSQDLSGEHQGKVTGIAGIAAWAFSPPAQKFFGRLVDRTHSFDAGLMVAAALPLVAWVVLLLFWPRTNTEPNPPLQSAA